MKRDSRDLEWLQFLHARPAPLPRCGVDDERRALLQAQVHDAGQRANSKQEVKGGWIAILQHYFIGAWVADPADDNHYYGHKREDGDYVVGFNGPTQSIAPGATGQFTSKFYAGPKDQARLEAIAPNLNLTVDYGISVVAGGSAIPVAQVAA